MYCQMFVLKPEYYLAVSRILSKPGTYEYGKHTEDGKEKPLLFMVDSSSATAMGGDTMGIVGGGGLNAEITREFKTRVGGEIHVHTSRHVKYVDFSWTLFPKMIGGAVEYYVLSLVSWDSNADPFIKAITALIRKPDARIEPVEG